MVKLPAVRQFPAGDAVTAGMAANARLVRRTGACGATRAMQNSVMFKFGQTEYFRSSFAEQFEADGDAYLYRRFRKGAPVRVSARERDDFVANFERSYKRAYLTMIIGLFVLAIGMIAITVAIGHELAKNVVYATIALWAAAFMLVHLRIWNAPARALERRPAVGVERSRAEMREIMMSEGSYLKFFGLLAFFLLLLFNLATQPEPLGYFDVALMTLYIAMIPMIATLILRKWHFDRRNRAS